MNNVNKRKIEEAVRTVYERTDNTCYIMAEERIDYVKPEFCGYVGKDVLAISRSVERDDLTYKLYTKHDTNPLITVFGCWPIDFVSDIFIKALEHFYDDYS